MVKITMTISNINNEKRKAGDKVGWKTELLIERRDEKTKSLEILYNRAEQEKIIPKHWQQVIIKSVDKKKKWWGTKLKSEGFIFSKYCL